MRAPFTHIAILIAFLVNTFGPIPMARAQDYFLPAPGVMVPLSPEFSPAILKGIKVHRENPFLFDFILDKGDTLTGPGSLRSRDQVRLEATKLIKYFLASLTIPEKDLWVNLSPYEKDRIIPSSFGLTEMGRDLLAEDYMLKQITASLIYPEDGIGKKFWKRVYEEAAKKYGTTNIPVSTFNKVWIVPEKAVVYENAKAGTAYVLEAKLKVMLEQDYLSIYKHQSQSGDMVSKQDTNVLGSQIIREIVIPELTREVNENKNFARLRQVYNSLILANWYKKKIKDSILEQVYADKNKITGINVDDPQEKEKIYQQYLKAFKKGVYNYIKEDIDPVTQGTTPRKYFSGGTAFTNAAMAVEVFTSSQGLLDAPAENILNDERITVELKSAGASFEELMRGTEVAPSLLQATVLKFEGIGGQDVYNPFIFKAKIHPEDAEETTIIAGRVEGRTSELSKVMFFQLEADGNWHKIEGARVFENAQDPSIKKIGDKLVLSMVTVVDRGEKAEKLDNGQHRLEYNTDFFQFTTLEDLGVAKPIAQGPLWMKDIRLVELKDGRILIMTRPQGRHYGPGKIAYLILKSFEEFIELAQAGKEGRTLAQLMENGQVLEGLFRVNQWGGTGDLNLLENGKVGVVGHIARFNDEGNREYAPITFEFDPETGKTSSLKMIGRWKALERLLGGQNIPIKVLDPKKLQDLSNVFLGTTLVLSKGRYFLLGGVRDTTTVLAEIKAPFTSPMADTHSDWSVMEKTLPWSPITQAEEYYGTTITGKQYAKFNPNDHKLYFAGKTTASNVVDSLESRGIELGSGTVSRAMIHPDNNSGFIEGFPAFESIIDGKEALILEIINKKDSDATVHFVYLRERIYCFINGKLTGTVALSSSIKNSPSGKKSYSPTLEISTFTPLMYLSDAGYSFAKGLGYGNITVAAIAKIALLYDKKLSNSSTSAIPLIKAYQRFLQVEDVAADKAGSFKFVAVRPNSKSLADFPFKIFRFEATDSNHWSIVARLSELFLSYAHKSLAIVAEDQAMRVVSVEAGNGVSYQEIFNQKERLNEVLITMPSGSIRLERKRSTQKDSYGFEAFFNGRKISADNPPVTSAEAISFVINGRELINTRFFLKEQGQGFGKVILDWIISYAWRHGVSIYDWEETINPDMLWMLDQELEEPVSMKVALRPPYSFDFGREYLVSQRDFLGRVESVNVVNLGNHYRDSTKEVFGVLDFDKKGRLVSFQLRNGEDQFVVKPMMRKGALNRNYELEGMNSHQHFHVEVIGGIKIRFFDDQGGKYSTRLTLAYVKISGRLKTPQERVMDNYLGNSKQASTPKGGIDLTSANMGLQTQNAGEEIKFHMDSATLRQLQNAPGFVPVVINIQPMTDLRGFLGIKNRDTLTF